MLSAAVIIDNGRPFQRYISIRQAAAVVGSGCILWLYTGIIETGGFLCHRRRGALSNTAIRPSVCPMAQLP